ncbi:MAG TPA: CHAT domain-containing protein [Brevundimonas sp.]|uniref:CHAT domain-containing protein n=1 Tax=Brevundimonas sp. TaxID=1871086 RepID=UPI00260AA897|nr:CHAT domain-containing protein [Brevundimonas sp.]HRO32428.1 CHAT domain-containing protein [Brevundimonas sp.]
MWGKGRLIAGLAALAAVMTVAGSGAARVDDTPESLRAEAFEAAQWAIASDAADALAKVSARFAEGNDALGRLAEERETLLARRDALELELERLYAVQGDEGRDRRAAARADYDAVRARLTAVDADIEARFPAYAELTSPRALTVAETQALLKPDEGLLLVLVNPEATYVWGLSRDRVEWARAEELGDAAMTAAVTKLRESLTTAAQNRSDLDPAIFAGRPVAAFDRAEAHRLYAELVQPVESVFEGKKTLITVVTGALTTLPLAVLSTQAPQGPDGPDALAATPWLIERYALATLPSVSSLKALRCHLVSDPALRSPGCPASAGAEARPAVPATPAARPFTLAAFGAPILAGAPDYASRGAPAADSVLGEGRLADVSRLKALPYLPGSKTELETLKTRYPRALVRIGPEATETAVRQADAAALSAARFVVFSTHGLMAGSTAAEPGLVLTPPDQATEADDGYLSASEAAQLRLNAEFVVLSACNTAASDGRPGGEGLSGLARAFFYAGARSVLVSHWEVSDAATTELITASFAALDTPGADIGDRARALQSGMRAVRANRAWTHPAFWAPFTLVGEPG